jgi:hypothetical protein
MKAKERFPNQPSFSFREKRQQIGNVPFVVNYKEMNNFGAGLYILTIFE